MPQGITSPHQNVSPSDGSFEQVGTHSETFRDLHPHDSDDEDNAPTANDNAGAAATTGDIAALMSFISHLKIPNSGIPIPSSHNAPWFKGHRLQKFIEEFEFIAENVGWSSVQKCKHVYCNTSTCDLVRALEPRKRGDWPGTVHALHQLYGSEDRTNK
jgi:hypothetical protein